MESKNILARTTELFSLFVKNIEGAKAQGLLDTNLVSEDVMLPILAKAFDCPNLTNANNSESASYPAVDLIDKKARIAFQITATKTPDKVKKTLDTFFTHGLHHDYDEVYVYILTQRQELYPQKSIKDILIKNGQEDFNFDRNAHIIDYRSILTKIKEKDPRDQVFIMSCLEREVGEGTYLPRGLVHKQQKPETVVSNLLEMKFPERLYLADLLFDKKEIVKAAKEEKILHKKRYDPSMREIARAALELQGIHFSFAWICHENQLITFYDLEDRGCPLRNIVDLGTITPLSPNEFYSINDDYENVFKSLLSQTLRQEMFYHDVQWQNYRKLYFFSLNKHHHDVYERKEVWHGKNKGTRTVCKRVLKDENSQAPGTILHYKHFAFEVKFLRMGLTWYLALYPDWFFSEDGYKPSYFDDRNVTNQKKLEKNKAIYQHILFLVYFLKNPQVDDLFSQSKKVFFLSYNNVLQFQSPEPLNDKVWLDDESKAEKKKMENSGELF